MPKQQARFINWTGAPADNGRRRRSGAPKVPWTPKRLRQIMWLYLLTPLSTEKIARIVEEAEQNRSIFHPQESSIRHQLRELLGPDYVNYHVRAQALGQGMNKLLSVRLKVRLRSIKNGEHTLAKYLNLARSTDPEYHLEPLDKSNQGLVQQTIDELEIFDERFVKESTDSGYDDESRRLDSTESEFENEPSISSRQETEQLLCRLNDRVAMRERFSWSSLTSSALSLALSAKRLSHSTCRTSLQLSARFSSIHISPDPPPGMQSSSDQPQQRDIRTMLLRLYPSMSASTLSKEAHDTLEELVHINKMSVSANRADGLTLGRTCCNIDKHCEQLLYSAESLSAFSNTHPITETSHLNQILCRRCWIRSGHVLAYAGVPLPAWTFSVPVFDLYGNSILHYAAAQSSVYTKKHTGLMSFLEHAPLMLNSTNQHGQTFLHHINPFVFGADGLLWDNIIRLAEIVKSVDSNFDFNKRDCHGQTFWHCICTALHGQGSLHSYCAMNPTSFFNALYYTNADVGRRDNNGLSIAEYFPHHFPTQTGCPDLWKSFLVKKGNDVVSVDVLKHDELHCFDSEGDTVLLSLIKEPTARWKATTNSSKEALIGDLITRGVPLEGRDRAGETALFIAAKTGQPCIVRTLLNHGARYSILNYSDKSLCAAARDAILEIRKQNTLESVRKEAEILACIITILDHQWGDPLPYNHRYAE